MTQPILFTERLKLVPLAREHLEFEVALDSDPEVMRYINGRAGSRAEVERAHRHRLRVGEKVPGLGFWVGFDGDAPIGWWILQPPNGPDQPRFLREADLGYRLAKEHWRRGYATEGARALVRYGFAARGLKRIFAQTKTANVASRATMDAVGLRPVRTFVSGARHDDSIPESEHDEVEYDITRKRWRKQNSRRTLDTR